MEINDDIIAISSPPGTGAIAIIRISGPKSISKFQPFFKSKNNKELKDLDILFRKIENDN